jgi:hypothetical protein
MLPFFSRPPNVGGGGAPATSVGAGLPRGQGIARTYRVLSPSLLAEKTRSSAKRLDRGLFGAGDRARTGDLLHGKQTLYQLSYTRIEKRLRVRRL